MAAVGIDKNDPTPLYYQIAQDMRAKIASGRWGPEDKLPSENQLTAQYGVSRIAVRQALAELEKDGLIVKRRGKGSFLTRRAVPFVHAMDYTLTSSQRFAGEGVSLTAQVLCCRQLAAGQQADSRTGFVLEEPAVFYRRLFLLEGRPVALSCSWLPQQLVPGLGDSPLPQGRISPQLYRRYGLQASRVEDYLEVVAPTASEAQQLQITRESSLLLLKGTAYLQDGRALEHSATLWVGDRVRFKFGYSL